MLAADPDRLLRVEGDEVRPAHELGMREVDAGVDNRDRDARARWGEPVEPDLLAPPLVDLEGVGRDGGLGDGVRPFGLRRLDRTVRA